MSRAGAAAMQGRRRIQSSGFDLMSGSLTRASEAWRWTGPNSGTWESSGVIRLDARDAGDWILVEGSRINYAAPSEDFTTTWTGSNATATGDTDTAPDGGADADTIAFSALQAARMVFGVSGSAGWTDNERIAVSVFARALSAQKFRIDVRDKAAIDTASADLDVTTAWARYALSMSVGVGGTNLSLRTPMNASDAVARSIFAWGIQLERAAFPSSYIRAGGSVATRQADLLTIPSGSIPPALLTNGAAFALRPEFSSQDVIDGTIGALVIFAVGANDLIYFRHNAGACEVALARGGAVVASQAVTFSRYQSVGVDYVPNTGATLSGFTTGNALLAHAGSALPGGTALTIGASHGGGNHYYGRVGRFPVVH